MLRALFCLHAFSLNFFPFYPSFSLGVFSDLDLPDLNLLPFSLDGRELPFNADPYLAILT